MGEFMLLVWGLGSDRCPTILFSMEYLDILKAGTLQQCEDFMSPIVLCVMRIQLIIYHIFYSKIVDPINVLAHISTQGQGQDLGETAIESYQVNHVAADSI